MVQGFTLAIVDSKTLREFAFRGGPSVELTVSTGLISRR
jgi:hypothetical protein